MAHPLTYPQVRRARIAATARTSARWTSSSSAPAIAPQSIAPTATVRRKLPLPLPPASCESAARPVSVIVRTVVVRSGKPIRLTVALRAPMPKASSAITTSPESALGVTVTEIASSAARPTAETSTRRERERWSARRERLPASLAPSTEPARKASRETSGARTGSPPLPATPKPSRTMLPVMFAVKTWPSPR